MGASAPAVLAVRARQLRSHREQGARGVRLSDEERRRRRLRRERADPGDVCNSPNYWAAYNLPPSNPGYRDVELLKSDPRNVRLFVVPYGAFDAAGAGGNKTVPVLGFARFYITGWEGNSSNEDPCPSADDDFDVDGDGQHDDPLPQGSVVGHFHMFVPEPPGSRRVGNGQPCGTIADTEPTPCIVVLVD